jgi:hypothetical protein
MTAGAAAAAVGLVSLLSGPLIQVGDVTVQVQDPRPIEVRTTTTRNANTYTLRIGDQVSPTADTLVAEAGAVSVTGSNATLTSSALTFLFHSDWSTATGTTDAALLDTSKGYPWDNRKDGNGGTAVTDTVDWNGCAPEGTNALSITHVSTSSVEGVRLGGTEATSGTLPEQQRGTSRGYRVCFKHVRPNGSVSMSARHPLQDGSPGSGPNWEFNTDMDGTDVYGVWFEISNATRAGETQTWFWSIDGANKTEAGAALPKDSVYRHEWLITQHPTTDSIDIEIITYNPDGSVRVAADRWELRCFNIDACGSSSDETWYFLPNNWEQHTRLQIGTNGWGCETTGTPYLAFHYTAMAVCNGWCGPYADGR